MHMNKDDLDVVCLQILYLLSNYVADSNKLCLLLCLHILLISCVYVYKSVDINMPLEGNISIPHTVAIFHCKFTAQYDTKF